MKPIMNNRQIKLAIIGAGYTQRQVSIDAAVPEAPSRRRL
jgi:hypothetical protein